MEWGGVDPPPRTLSRVGAELVLVRLGLIRVEEALVRFAMHIRLVDRHLGRIGLVALPTHKALKPAARITVALVLLPVPLAEAQLVSVLQDRALLFAEGTHKRAVDRLGARERSLREVVVERPRAGRGRPA